MECKICGKEFEKNVHNQKYCSDECKKERKNTARKSEPFQTKCVYCGEIFISKRKGSKSCGKRDMLHRVNEKVLTTKTICDCCGKIFEQPKYTHKKNVREQRKNYCNAKCMGEAYKDRIKLTCSECGETFERAKSGVVGTEKHYFCSKECQAKNIDYILRGEYHFRYIDGESKNNRGKGWIRTRKEVRLRDNYTCGICGITEKEIGKALDVHHIKPYRLFDDSEEANSINNLISLCPSCHHREEYKTALIEKEKIWQILNYQQRQGFPLNCEKRK